MASRARINEEYKKRLISVDDAIKKVKSNDEVVFGLAAAEPKLFMRNVFKIKDKVENVNLLTTLPMEMYNFYTSEESIGHFNHMGWFYTAPIRKGPSEINSFIPNHLHLAGVDRLTRRKPNIFVGTATPPDKHGYMSLSLSATYEVDMLEAADIVILEVNSKYPKTFGDVIIHISQVDHIIEADYDPPEIPIPPTSDKDRQLAAHISEFLEDGVTLQLGIGGIPNAVAAGLSHLNDIGVHTEMLTEGIVDLFENGVITGRNKTLLPGKMVCTFALGTKKLYDFIDDNPGVVINRGHWVNNPYVISQNYKQVSINTALEVDLTGQVCSESIGPKQFSGTGGQADTAIGAQMSEGGKSFITLYSTASVKDPATGDRKPITKIVPMLKQGAQVTLHRANVDYIVTEYGVVRLKGLSVRDRVKKLISIAHPDFRDYLTEEAKKLRYI